MEGHSTHGDMHEGQADHQQHRHNTFWINNEISFTFILNQQVVDRTTLFLDELKNFLRHKGFNLMIPDPLTRIYQFADPQNTDPNKRLVVAFFRFTEIGAPVAVAQEIDLSNHKGAQTRPLDQTPEARLVNVVNAAIAARDQRKKEGDDGYGREQQDKDQRVQEEHMPVEELSRENPITSGGPHWLSGASDHITTGCPLMPPIPLSSDKRCSTAHGLWPISLPGIPRNLNGALGDGVTVIVMDTLPPRHHIKRAAQGAGSHNLLLLDLNDNVKFSYPELKDEIDQPGPLQPGTGKDAEGQTMGFHMPDHGLFVAGIIRSLAPNAEVECIRVLSDLGAGAAEDLIKQLNGILDRKMSGDLKDGDVVINLSLVTPSDDDVKESHIDTGKARENLREAIRSLASHGVVFSASAGNEGDSRVITTNGVHPDVLYPAAFAYADEDEQGNKIAGIENMVPVGAVNQKVQAAQYSCYPGKKGVAAYAGELPHVYSNDGRKVVDIDKLDAPIGVYTQLYYPTLFRTDEEATYPAPNAHGWAYWIGTSFATPIVSAIAARAFELKKVVAFSDTIPDYIHDQAATTVTKWVYREGEDDKRVDTIVATQCGHMYKEHHH